MGWRRDKGYYQMRSMRSTIYTRPPSEAMYDQRRISKCTLFSRNKLLAAYLGSPRTQYKPRLTKVWRKQMVEVKSGDLVVFVESSANLPSQTYWATPNGGLDHRLDHLECKELGR